MHVRIHSGEKPFVCGCLSAKCQIRSWCVLLKSILFTGEDCGRPFTVASNLRRHQKIHVKQVKMAANDVGPIFHCPFADPADDELMHFPFHRLQKAPPPPTSNSSTIKARAANRAKKDHDDRDYGGNVSGESFGSEDDGDDDLMEGEDAEGDGASTDGEDPAATPSNPAGATSGRVNRPARGSNGSMTD